MSSMPWNEFRGPWEPWEPEPEPHQGRPEEPSRMPWLYRVSYWLGYIVGMLYVTLRPRRT